MNLITFAPLEISRSTLRVAWKVEPATELYSRENFTLDFGSALDPRDLPLKLLWTVALLCLHSHWNILRPCSVRLPVRLPEGEIEFWQRLLDGERASLEYVRRTADFERTISIECSGEMLVPGTLPQPSGRYATAYSGGKDSLLQAALLCEVTSRPLLVNVCSPMPPLREHAWPHRERSLKGMAERRDVELVVVHSDLRSCWPHYEVPHKLGYPISMAEMTDTFLYLAATVAVAASRGIRCALLAAEFECGVTFEHAGHTASPADALTYSPVVLGSLSRLLEQWDMQCTSLITPLSDLQIEEMICRRYPDLLDLQISCFWMNNDADAYCSRCHKCLRIAILLMATGVDPAKVGIDVNKLFPATENFILNIDVMEHKDMVYAASLIDPAAFRRLFRATTFLERLGLRGTKSFLAFKNLTGRISSRDTEWLVGRRPEYERFLPPGLRAPLAKLFIEQWPGVDTTDRGHALSFIKSAVDWTAEPLRAYPKTCETHR